MSRYLTRRLLQAIPIFFGITVLSYALMLGTPGGPVKALAFNQRLKPEEIRQLEAQLGVNDPFFVQYLRWLTGDDWLRWDSDGDGKADGALFIDLYTINEDGEQVALPPGRSRGILRGDFGNSFFHRRPAIEVLLERMPATIELGVSSLVLGVLVGVVIGVLAAIAHGHWFDQFSRVAAVIVNAVPNFWLGLILLLVFGSLLGVLPLGNRCRTTLADTCPPLYERLEYLILPTLVLSAGTVAAYSRFTRASMLDVIRQDYMRTARSKGLTERAIWFRHGMRNALIPAATFLGPSITFILSGAAVTETVFSWPGVGRLAVNAVSQRDYPIVMVVVIYSSIATILGFLLSDVLYAWIDPRIRFD